MHASNSRVPDEQLFLSLVADLVTQTWIALGKIKNPVSDQIERSVPAAAMLIDMLDMLVRKTDGHRSPEEDQMLSESLKQLKLNYVVESNKTEETVDKGTDEAGPVESDDSESPASGGTKSRRMRGTPPSSQEKNEP